MLEMNLAKVRQVTQLLQYFGPQWVALRAIYAIRMRTGVVEQTMPPYEWHKRPLASWLKLMIPSSTEDYFLWRKEHAPRFLFSSLPPADSLEDPPIMLADALLQGSWICFEHEFYQTSFP